MKGLRPPEIVFIIYLVALALGFALEELFL